VPVLAAVLVLVLVLVRGAVLAAVLVPVLVLVRGAAVLVFLQSCCAAARRPELAAGACLVRLYFVTMGAMEAMVVA
jgi:hypothetical protein